MRPHRLPIDSDHSWLMTLKAETKDASIRAIDQAKANALAASDRESLADAAVDSHGVADTTIVRHVMHVAKVVADLRIGLQPPVLQQPGHVAVHADGISLFDDQGSAQSASHLLSAVLVRVIPRGTGVGHVELLNELRAWSDRGLRQMRHAIHGVGQADAVEVHRGLFRQLIFDGHF